MKYLVKMPAILQRWVFPNFIWKMPAGEKKVYLTFDDGPHPAITPFVLDELKRCGAKATFFCIGKNVEQNPWVYKRIIMEGHSVGNHTFNHLNGWNTSDSEYFKDVTDAAKLIDSALFRPPYGRITRFQSAQLREHLNYRIIMWSVLSGDFDQMISGEKCLKNVLDNTVDGSVIVFHDSEKAFDRLKYTLRLTLDRLSELGYRFEALR